MSEPGVAAAGAQDPAASRPTAGAMLRQMREAAGVSAAQVASAMKVAPQKLQALEDDRLDELPNVTFARALASGICRAFGADPATVLARMPVVVPELRVPDHPINQRIHRSGDQPEPMVGRRMSRLLLIAITALVVVVAVLWLLPTLPIQLGAPAGQAVPAPAASLPDEVGASGAPPQSAPTALPADAASATPGAAATPALAASATAALPAASVAASADVHAGQAAGDLLGFTAASASWVSVRDAAGKELVNRTLAAGETLGVNAAPPLSVTVGRKEAIAVTVRGKPFDIKSRSPADVARFTVK